MAKHDNPVVKMVQIQPHCWKILSPNNKIIKEDIYLAKHEVIPYIKQYCSSFLNWQYEIIPLKDTHDNSNTPDSATSTKDSTSE